MSRMLTLLACVLADLYYCGPAAACTGPLEEEVSFGGDSIFFDTSPKSAAAQ